MNSANKIRISLPLIIPLQLSVIIVNYNVKYFLEQCLCSVTKAVQNLEAEIFVVDNNSSDGSQDFFKDKFNKIKFIWNTENMGFSKANNAAFEKARGEYILFLNPDTIVPEDCFEKCISFFTTHPETGALGVRMIDGKGNFLRESKRSFPSPLTSLYKLLGLAALFPRSGIFAKYHLGNIPENENHEVDVLAGAFMMTKGKVLGETGIFDEAFFMYGEDIDMSYRVQKSGFKNYYFSETSIIHFKGESTKKGSLNYVRMFYKAMSVFVKKHYSKKRAGLFNFSIQIAIFLRAMVSVIGNAVKRIWRFIKVHIKKRDDKRGKTIIIGIETEFEKVKKIIAAANIDDKSLNILSITLIDDLNTRVLIERLLFLNKTTPVKEIILCQGKLSFKNVIELTEKIPKSIKIKFHCFGSRSIVGSDERNIR